jgi:hypothetical protein
MPKKKTSMPKHSPDNVLPKGETGKPENQEEQINDYLNNYQSVRGIAQEVITEIETNSPVAAFKLLAAKLQNAAFDDKSSHLIFNKIESYLIRVNGRDLENDDDPAFEDEFEILAAVAGKYYADKWKRKLEAFEMPKQLTIVKKELSKTSMKYLSAGLKIIESELEKEADLKEPELLEKQNRTNEAATKSEYENGLRKHVNAKKIKTNNFYQAYFAFRILLCDNSATDPKKFRLMSFLSQYSTTSFSHAKSDLNVATMPESMVDSKSMVTTTPESRAAKRERICKDLDRAIIYLELIGITERMKEEISSIKRLIRYPPKP